MWLGLGLALGLKLVTGKLCRFQNRKGGCWEMGDVFFDAYSSAK